MLQTESGRQTIVENTLRIGQLAAAASVGVETIRFYEREGLLERPHQHLSGYRGLPDGGSDRVQTIKRTQTLGFTLAEIRKLLRGSAKGQLLEQATKKVHEIDATIAELQLVRQELARVVEYRCDRLVGCSCGEDDCPVNPTGAISRPRPTGIDQRRSMVASQAWAPLSSIVTANVAGSIDLIDQPSRKAARSSVCDTRRGPQSPGWRSLKHIR